MKLSRKIAFSLCLCFYIFRLTIASQHVHNFEMSEESVENFQSSHATENDHRRYRRGTDELCQQREETFLKDIYSSGKPNLAKKQAFASETSNSMALAWLGDKGGLMVVTSMVENGRTNSSSVHISKDYGVTFTKFEGILTGAKIRKHNGVLRNPYNSDKAYLIEDGVPNSVLYITEDAGRTFIKIQLDFAIVNSLTFHNKDNSDCLIAQEVNLYNSKIHVSINNGKSWRPVLDFVEAFKWGTSENDPPHTIYATVDPTKTTSFLVKAFYQMVYELKKSTDAGQTWTTILKDVISFGHQGKFLYATVLTDPSKTTTRVMKVSSDGGKTWGEAQLPTLSSDMFYSVMDMQEDLVFMHVDDPGDTGHGTLYTSAGKGILYSTSLKNHLYPNYGDVTDFYRVQSMRGVYLASQMSEDDSIHTVITYNRGATWHNVPRPSDAPCKDEKLDCNLQIHGTYSLARGILAQPPFSIPNAVGIILVHGHVADALQTSHPDVFISSDGGYKWRKALTGPHHYHIADSGSLIVAVPADTDTPKLLKFSTDEGRCWHNYQFVSDKDTPIKFTGLILEPGSKSLAVTIWGYHPTDRVWTTYVIDFMDVLKNKCKPDDYETWKAHETLRADENENVKGCLLGIKEQFKRQKHDSWCYNGREYDVELKGTKCVCTKEDYECDYGYYRRQNDINCVRNTTMKSLDYCLQGRVEEVITVGYRRVPGDVCEGGFSPTGKQIQLKEYCKEGSKKVIEEDEATPKRPTGNMSVIAAIVVVVVVIVIFMVGYFGYKLYILRQHNVVYRYSLLNQNESQDYDNDFENALSNKSVVYQDSSDEELNSPAVKVSNGKKPTERTRLSNMSGRGKVKSYHDDSDVDMLE